jgi:hypothetical protein
MKRRALLVLLLALVVLAAGCSEPKGHRASDTSESQVELTLVWKFKRAGETHEVYEFTDQERGEHCYVMFPGNATYGVALSCERVGK